MIHQLQKKNKIKRTEVLSPTFSLLHEYEIKSFKVLHYDLYRLNKPKELNKLGIFQENRNVITIIEWPKIINKKIKNRLEITFYNQEEPESRKLKIKGFGKWKKFKLNAI